jgi:hypothetical protein
MFPVQSIKLSVVCGAVLGASIACLIAFAQGPTPVSKSFPTPTLNSTASPPPGVQASGVAVPIPVLEMRSIFRGDRMRIQTLSCSLRIFRRTSIKRSTSYPRPPRALLR